MAPQKGGQASFSPRAERMTPSSTPLAPSAPPRIFPPPAAHCWISAVISRRQPSCAASPLTIDDSRLVVQIRPAAGGRSPLLVLRQAVEASPSSSVSLSRPPCGRLGSSSPAPALGLLYLFLIISMVIGSFLAVAVVSLPAMGALRKLEVAMGRLFRTAEEEVPATLMSLKLSVMEISELARKLSSLRQLMPRSGSNGRKDRRSGLRAETGGADPLII